MLSMAKWRQGGVPETNLGFLEREMMEHLWRLEEASVASVHERIGGRLAYTTIMTTLDRLYKKGILHRRKQGRAFFYSASFTREEFNQNLVKRALRFLLQEHNKETAPLMAHLVETFKEHDARLLDELERMIRQSRRRSRNEEE